VPIECEPPLHWITPGAIEARLTAAAEMLSERPVVPPRGHYLLRAHEELIDARLSITQNGLVDPDGGPVVIRVTKARLR
jgi:hypothetical protein